MSLLTLAFALLSVGVTFSQTSLPPTSLFGKEVFKMNAEEKLNKYAEQLALCDIHVNAPEDYKTVNMTGNELITNNISSTWNDSYPGYDYCQVALEDIDKNSIILFPNLMFVYPNTALRASYTVIDELQAVNHDFEMDVTPLVKAYYNTDKSSFAGADTIVVYEFKFENKLFDNYEYCVGVYLRSESHPAVPMKIALTKDAYEDKEKYIKLLLDCIRFGDEPNEIFLKAENETKGIKDQLFYSDLELLGISELTKTLQ